MVGFLGGDHRSVGHEREMNSGIWHQVGLELIQIDVEGTIKAERGRDGGHNLNIKKLTISKDRYVSLHLQMISVHNSEQIIVNIRA